MASLWPHSVLHAMEMKAYNYCPCTYLSRDIEIRNDFFFYSKKKVLYKFVLIIIELCHNTSPGYLIQYYCLQKTIQYVGICLKVFVIIITNKNDVTGFERKPKDHTLYGPNF